MLAPEEAEVAALAWGASAVAAAIAHHEAVDPGTWMKTGPFTIIKFINTSTCVSILSGRGFQVVYQISVKIHHFGSCHSSNMKYSEP